MTLKEIQCQEITLTLEEIDERYPTRSFVVNMATAKESKQQMGYPFLLGGNICCHPCSLAQKILRCHHDDTHHRSRRSCSTQHLFLSLLASFTISTPLHMPVVVDCCCVWFLRRSKHPTVRGSHTVFVTCFGAICRSNHDAFLSFVHPFFLDAC